MSGYELRVNFNLTRLEEGLDWVLNEPMRSIL